MRKYLLLFGISALAIAGCHNNSTNPPAAAPTHFTVTPLAANKVSYAAANIDTNLQDSWGLAFNTQVGYPWIANRASGRLTIYDSMGMPKKAVYYVAGANGQAGNPTGIIQDTTSSFFVPAAGVSATWITAGLDGTISAVADGGDSTFQIVNRSVNSTYTGLALTRASGVANLFAPNVRNQTLDRFGANLSAPTQYPTQHYNEGYTPFNAVIIDTQMFVTSAKWTAAFPYFAVGSGQGGYVDVYDLSGTYERTLISNDSLDEPWGVAIAPASFGSFSGDLLVGNFGNGEIHVYNRSTGAFIGTLTNSSGSPIVIPGLWALVVYNGTLYYTAGPNGGTDGVFGKISMQ